MNITGIGIDYSNICKEYNTSYLDRDNKDGATTRCMQQVLEWTRGFFSELAEHFGFEPHLLNDDVPVSMGEIASKRFLFYSLEKAITLQSFVMQKASKAYDSPAAWAAEGEQGVLIRNDEDGEGIYLYLAEGSAIQHWIMEKLKDFTLDDVPFAAK